MIHLHEREYDTCAEVQTAAQGFTYPPWIKADEDKQGCCFAFEYEGGIGGGDRLIFILKVKNKPCNVAFQV